MAYFYARSGQIWRCTTPTDTNQRPQDTKQEAADNQHEACLKAHNDARAAKGCKPLQWDSALAREAELYAQVLARKDVMEHSQIADRPNQGENLFWCSRDIKFDVAVKIWMDEEKDYHGQRIGEGNFANYGHFSA